MTGDGLGNGNRDGQIIALIQDLRRDVTKRLDDLDAKFDSLPDRYPTRREFEGLQEAHRATSARIDRFEEWRAAQIERQYQTLLNVTTRADDTTVETLREDKREAKAQQSTLRTGITRWQIAIVGWMIVLALWVGDLVAAHWH